MLTKVASATTWGITTYPIDVEVDLSFGMMQFHIVGLPDAAIRESKQRIMTALKQCGFRIPERKITVNLAPADLKKEGTLFDLPIALGILHEAGLIKMSAELLNETFFLGELSLDGSIKPIRGIIPIACDCRKLGKKRLIVALENSRDAACIDEVEVFGVSNLIELVDYIRGEKVLVPTARGADESSVDVDGIDFGDVAGQFAAKRALQVAAAGRHNILMIGSPGSGKTMLAQRLRTILPPPSLSEMLEISKIYSISGKLKGEGLMRSRPFRAPHHTISAVGLIGGGSVPKVGEISLAHNGVLFLDELTEFVGSTLDALRQPLESREVSIVRAQYAVTFPASFLLVGALNPCPCGFLGDKRRPCVCSTQRVQHYLGKLSGPLLDRMDLQVSISSLQFNEIEASALKKVDTAQLYAGVLRAVSMQERRRKTAHQWNGAMSVKEVERYCVLTERAQAVLKQAFERMNLTMRSYHKMLKIARTIADIEESELIDVAHIQEAMTYRMQDYLALKQ